jgi:hypothetical protein
MAAINLNKTIEDLHRKGWGNKMLSRFVTSLEERELIRITNGKRVVDDLWEHAETFKREHSSDGVSAP